MVQCAGVGCGGFLDKSRSIVLTYLERIFGREEENPVILTALDSPFEPESNTLAS
jgi:hypothetical protein